jgi:thioredoxin-disulfide reductase
MNKYDIVVVGAGPAGLSAAIYGVRAGKSVLVLEALTHGGQIVNTPEIENYPGIKNISGFEFAQGLYEQAVALGAIVKYEKVNGIEVQDNIKLVKTAKEIYEAKAVILATGAKNRSLGLEREDSLLGLGISYCATCDGAFYRGRDVAVAGGGNTAIEDATFLANYCNKVYVIHRRDSFRAEDALVKALKTKENVEFVLDSNIKELIGTDGLEAVVVENKNNKEFRKIEVAGLFVAIGQKPENNEFSSVVNLDDAGYILGGEDTKTNVSGIFVAGDTRTKAVRQLATAAGDGAVAGLGAAAYIDQNF